MLKLNGDAEVALAAPSNATLWADMMVRFAPGNDAPVTPAVGADTGFGLSARTNGHLAVRHRNLAQATNVWTQLDRTVDTARWYRVTVRLDYGTADAVFGARYFELDVDGLTVSNAAAYSTNNGLGSAGGTWFASASTSAALSRLVFGAGGYVDDITVGTRNPGHRLAPRGTPEWWLAGHGLTNAPSGEETSDTDFDGMQAWQEFVAGTDPTNPASLFRFTASPAILPGPRRAMRFDSVPGRRYGLGMSTNLPSGFWSEALFALSTNGSLSPGPFTATGTATTIFVEPGLNPEFYRGTVEREGTEP